MCKSNSRHGIGNKHLNDTYDILTVAEERYVDILGMC